MRTRERERESYKAKTNKKELTKKSWKKKETKVGKIYMKDSSQNRILMDRREDYKQNKKTSKKGNKNKGKNYETIKNT